MKPERRSSGIKKSRMIEGNKTFKDSITDKDLINCQSLQFLVSVWKPVAL